MVPPDSQSRLQPLPTAPAPLPLSKQSLISMTTESSLWATTWRGLGGAAGVGEGAPSPWGPVAPEARSSFQALTWGPAGVQDTDPALGGGGGGHTSRWVVRGLVLTRVPPACVLLCQRGRVSSTGKGVRVAPRWEAGPWPGEVDNKPVSFCLPQPVMSGRDPRLSQPPIALPNCFCLHPFGEPAPPGSLLGSRALCPSPKAQSTAVQLLSCHPPPRPSL